MTRVVYTALIGGYEQLVEQPVAKETEVAFVCLTDDPTLTSSTWTVVTVQPRFPADLIRSSRRLKILGDPALDAYDETLWIDNRIQLLVDPTTIFDSWLAETDFALPLHSYRETLVDEFREIVDLGFDDSDRVYEQLIHYLRNGAEVLERQPLWTGIMARRRTPAVAAAMTRWFEDIARYSRRDQLSLPQVLEATQLAYRAIEIDNQLSEVHRWLDAIRLGRSLQRNADAFRRAMEPAPVAERDLRARLGAAERELVQSRAVLDALQEHGHDLYAALTLRETMLTAADDRMRTLEQARAAAEVVQAALDEELAGAAAALSGGSRATAGRTRVEGGLAAVQRARIEAEEGRAAAEREIAALRSTLSWRVTAPLRAVRRMGGRR